MCLALAVISFQILEFNRGWRILCIRIILRLKRMRLIGIIICLLVHIEGINIGHSFIVGLYGRDILILLTCVPCGFQLGFFGAGFIYGYGFEVHLVDCQFTHFLGVRPDFLARQNLNPCR